MDRLPHGDRFTVSRYVLGPSLHGKTTIDRVLWWIETELELEGKGKPATVAGAPIEAGDAVTWGDDGRAYPLPDTRCAFCRVRIHASAGGLCGSCSAKHRNAGIAVDTRHAFALSCDICARIKQAPQISMTGLLCCNECGRAARVLIWNGTIAYRYCVPCAHREAGVMVGRAEEP
jgi:hypothetical protein